MIAVLDREIHILAGARTPIGRFRGQLSSYSAPELGGLAVAAALSRASVPPTRVDMVTMGCVISSGLGEAPAKQAALAAGLPPSVYTRSVENVCGSALEAVMITIDALLLERARVAVAGGMESRTHAPYLLSPRFLRNGKTYQRDEYLRLKKSGAYRWQYGENIEEQASLSAIIDATAYDGLFWPVDRKFMREYALAFARGRGITLESVNRAAATSHAKARRAQAEGRFDAEIVPAGGARRDDLVSDEELERMRREAEEDIAAAFNSSTPADNGAAVVLAGPGVAAELGLSPLARIMGFSRIDRTAADFIDAPVQAVRDLQDALQSRGSDGRDFTVMEINEAFGVQIPVFEESFSHAVINVNGGAVALGHPLGSAGVRLLVTLIHIMKQQGHRRGICAICYGGGGAAALAVEAV
jgi:acetyl-CoA C-acetyltransferase